MQNGCIPCKIALHLKKVCYKLSFVNTVSDKVSEGRLLSIRGKTVRGGRLRLRENLAESNQPPLKMQISDQYSLIVPHP